MSKLHVVDRAFSDIAKPLSEAFPEGAFIVLSDLEKAIVKQASKKFDIPQIEVGMPSGKDACIVQDLLQIAALVKILTFRAQCHVQNNCTTPGFGENSSVPRDSIR